MKKILILLFVGLLIARPSASAQNTETHPHHKCGTSLETQEVMKQNMIELRNRYPNQVVTRAITYVPVWFHLVAASDGTGRTTPANVADMVCEWNKIYTNTGLEIQFFIKGFSEINLTALYNAPQSFAGTNRMLATKKTDAMNVYMTNNAGDGTSPGTVLAYYSNRSSSLDAEYTNDWIVCTNSQTGSAGTIAHEAGHFFTLPHTFYGWEATEAPTAAAPCAPTSINANGRIVQVEKVARTGLTKNCDVAADGFCDTPADYNLGFGWTGNCTWSGVVKDPDCVPLDPDETNLMGYFLNCIKNFSVEQKTAMLNNLLLHPKRAYLRGAPTPPLTSTLPTLIAPVTGSTTTYFNNMLLDWSDVPGVLGYAVDVSRFSSFTSGKSFFLTASELNLNASNAGIALPVSPSLPPNLPTTIYWRVRAVVPYKNCDPIVSGNFKLGLLNAVNEIAGVTKFTVSPNPLSKSQNLTLEMNSETAFDAQIKLVNVTGQVVKREKRAFATGYSAQSISVSDLTNGTYILSIESDKGVLNKRIVIQ